MSEKVLFCLLLLASVVFAGSASSAAAVAAGVAIMASSQASAAAMASAQTIIPNDADVRAVCGNASEFYELSKIDSSSFNRLDVKCRGIKDALGQPVRDHLYRLTIASNGSIVHVEDKGEPLNFDVVCQSPIAMFAIGSIVAILFFGIRKGGA